MTNECPRPNVQAARARLTGCCRPFLVIGAWAFIGSLVIGHWLLRSRSLVIGPSMNFSRLASKRRNLLPHPMQPAFALVVADGAFGNEADAGVGHVVTEDGVVRVHILAP